MREIRVMHHSGRDVNCYVYYENTEGQLVLRQSVALTESPLIEGLYLNEVEIPELSSGDFVVAKDETSTPAYMVYVDTYVKDPYNDIQEIKEKTNLLTFTSINGLPYVLSSNQDVNPAAKKEIYVEDTQGNALDCVQVWITRDAAGEDVIYTGYTNTHGKSVVYLTSGRYYLFLRKAGHRFDSPVELNV